MHRHTFKYVDNSFKYFRLFCYLGKLDRHLFAVHKWDKLRSSSARLNFGLRKKREQPGCMKDVLRIHNHLRQTHKITDSVRINELTKKAKRYSSRKKVKKVNLYQKIQSNSSDSDSGEKEELIRKVCLEQLETENYIGERDSDGELDWLAEEFNAIYEERNNIELSQKALMENIEEERDEYLEYDNEDLEEKFYLSGEDEDALLLKFVNWLTSVSGGKRSLREARKHKNIVMGIVRHNDGDINYDFLACPSFLNSWMTKLTNEGKDPGTIRTHLNSVKQFIDLGVAEESGLFENQNIEKIRVLLRQRRNTLTRECEELEKKKQLAASDFFPCPSEIERFDKSEISGFAKYILKMQTTLILNLEELIFP